MERSGKMTIEEVLAVEEMQVFDRKSVNIAPKVLAIPIIAFANADGGTVAIGISDKTRRIEGVDYDIHQVLKETGIEPDIRFSSMDDHVVISMVANNLGISMLPNLVIGNARAQIQALPLEPNFSRELGIGIRSYAGLSPAAQQFIATIQEHINTF